MKKFIIFLTYLFLIIMMPLGWAFQTTVHLFVPDMTCPVCPITVKKALENVSGVENVKIIFNTKTAIVTFDSNKTTPKQLISATTLAGYPSKEEQQIRSYN